MDILILDSWLRDFLETKAKPSEIAKYLSLCGPSVDKVEKIENDFIYHIEATTNRIDSASVYGIAREAAAILPRFGLKAKLKLIRSESNQFSFVKKVDYLQAIVDPKLCSRFTAVLIENVKIEESPDEIKRRLEFSGIRPISNVVDISNYVMLMLGQPVHIFDYDKIQEHKMILRESKKGEKITTLDGKDFILPGGDIVIEDGGGRLIDLAGIMGGNLSAVDNKTCNILLFVQTYNPVNIRKTSMALAQRTQAASIFEKGTDEELVASGIISALDLFKNVAKGPISKTILDIYPRPYRPTDAKISLEYIISRLGVEINKKDIVNYLQSLGFESLWGGTSLNVKVPSWRSKDIKNEEDVLEEIARIYGYHNLPSKIMEGSIPESPEDLRFTFEKNIKNIISGFGGMEVYTLSLVSKNQVEEKALKLKNPLGPETEYLRTSLMPSLINAAKENVGTVDKFHIFEMANVYIYQKDNLPKENLSLGGIFFKYDYRSAKGIVEAFLLRLHIPYEFRAEEYKGFDASKCTYIYSGGEIIGKFGVVENSNFIYYEFDFDNLYKSHPKTISFNPMSKYPSQEEDITLSIPEKTHIIDVAEYVCQLDKDIEGVVFVGNYKNNFTLHIKYHDDKKTLTDKEVEIVRKKILSSVKSKFGANIKE